MMNKLFEDTENGADFSTDRNHRYALWRIWDKTKPLVMFIGLNPSTANEDTNDPTIRRVISISKNLGYGGVYMCNVFSFVSTNPQKVIENENVISVSVNLAHLTSIAEKCAEVIFAWGNFNIVSKFGCNQQLSKLFPNAKALFINKNGSPKHPLYCKSDIVPINYK